MGKYALSKEFGIYAYINPPLYKAFLPLLQRIVRRSAYALHREPGVKVSVHTARGGVRLFVVEPEGARPGLPCLLFLHGGAFAMPAYVYHYRLAARYARECPCKVVLADYGLVPSRVWPSQLEDSLSALEWIAEHADALSIDAERIAVYGDSAGGQLAALTAWRAGERLHRKLSFQMLVYPVLDPAMRTESMRRYTDTPLWNAKLNRKMWKWYLEGATDAVVSPLDDALPPDLPPVHLETAEFDCLHDEGVAYAERLRRAGVPVTLRENKAAMHGFEIVDGPVTEAAIRERLRYFREAWYGRA